MLSGLFMTRDFMPHVHCYLNRPSLVWSMASTDLAIGLAYVGISVTLWVLVRKIRLPFSPVVLCFGLFIAACGATHFMEVWTLWYPDYWLAAGVKVVTAIASLGTFAYLLALRPEITRAAERARGLEQKASERIEASERRFVSMFQVAPYPIALVKMPSGRLTEINPAFERVFGYAKEEVIGKTSLEIGMLEDAQAHRQAASELSKTGSVRNAYRYLRTKSGALLTVLANMESLNIDGEEYVLTTMEDVTARLAAEEALRKSEAQFRQLADSMPQIVWTTWDNQQASYLNQRWWDYVGRSGKEATTHQPVEFVHPDEANQVISAMVEAITEKKVFEMEYRLRRHDGNYRWHLGRMIPFFDSEGNFQVGFGTATDVDDQKRLSIELKATLQSRDEFISICSHELKTPLTALKLLMQKNEYDVELGRAEALSAEAIVKKARTATQQVDRIARLVDDMLDVGRIFTGHLAIQTERTDFSMLVKTMVDRFVPQFDQARINLTLKTAPKLMLRCDAARMEQVIGNLFSNLIKYAPAQAATVTVSKDGGDVLLRVSDQGPGIAVKDQTRIFNRFERAVSAENVSGLGIGLYISRQIVEAHQGRITVESQPGRGSTFFVRIPQGES